MPRIIDGINSPGDLKKLNIPMMNKLAEEIRELLVHTVSQCGGHLAANLGVVELTLALHYVFNSPVDKIIWDVGHQSYVHKILTGRKDKMPTLRQYGGLSGFPKYEESAHDVFNTGHSSTSISAALGLALARDLKGEKYSVVAVIGDGALTGGMAFEALNHAGHAGTDILVVLNDNEMSISKNVGALSSYLNRLRTQPSYFRTKEEIETVLHKIPGIGPNIARAAGRVKDMVKYIMVPGVFFEELGFTYIGPVNGHDLHELTLVLANAKKMKGPVLIHAITEKGRGYEPARRNPDIFHGIGPFDVDTGSPIKKTVKTYTEIFSEFIVTKAEQDRNIVAITAAMAGGTGLESFAKKFPDRFFDVGICEQHAVTLAAGMARGGLRPVVAIYSTFLQRAYDQIIHDVALQRLPVVFAIDRAGLVGEDGPTHHGVFDISYLRSIPNLVIMAPADENEFLDMLETAFTLDMPVAVRYPRGVGEGVRIEENRNIIAPGKSRLLQEGKDLGIIAVGRGMSIARDVVKLLQEKGVEVYLVDARFIKPLDEEQFIKMAKKVKRLVTIEEGCLAGGFGSSVLEILADNGIEADVMRIGVPDEFIDHGKVEVLWEYIGMNPVSVAESIASRWPDLLDYKKWELFRFGQS
ncbi:1-deoxy-D-xylulose-5-phosphate synthase [Thermosyntropha lipolytica DSM 11003]|uniref:1-deoxy-D-xylulose-5-phosphate synthase n=1 Tax=Thermosyntropha lipolytica DSM 11003 TaxID=1123382 RepID=A0A1M5LIA7_9FIRM|nr:1-deoxy-D-xylulose-5-phosphate synthase [Thermosyntropha lipolytica]SHG64777.1 1-deoxy-D-xylulose-5-phosphate synthase [Thermosyntropha lipolytica DSM 11003]